MVRPLLLAVAAIAFFAAAPAPPTTGGDDGVDRRDADGDGGSVGRRRRARAAADAFAPPAAPSRRRRRRLPSPSGARAPAAPLRGSVDLDGLRDGGGDGGGGEEWRAFRARLVRDGLPSLGDEAREEGGADGSLGGGRIGYAHLTPLVEVGSVLISIPTSDLCQALDQQYWHRSVVLITEVSDDAARGSVEASVPEEELARGEKRGRWSYRGLMLNRCTDFELRGGENATGGGEGRGSSSWTVQRGGDLRGLDSAAGTEYACLHNIARSDAASANVVGDLQYTTLSIARSLCEQRPDEYDPSDFATFAGFCSWRPGQLEREMGAGREEWVVISVDGQTIWKELGRQMELSKAIEKKCSSSEVAGELLEAGSAMWRNFLAMVDITEEEATRRLPRGQLNFYDRMLGVWAQEQLAIPEKRGSEPPSKAIVDDCSERVGPGTLARATSPPTNDMLLYDAEFVQSLVLVLEDTNDATVGIILNRPMAAAVDCVEDRDPLPLRYGGPVDIPSWRDGSYREDDMDGEGDEAKIEDDVYEGFQDFVNDGISFEDFLFDEDFAGLESRFDDDDSSFVWIHRNPSVGLARGGGTRLGTSNFWLIREDDALERMQSGLLWPGDVMVFSGVCIWEKGRNLGACGGGLREQVDALKSFELVRGCDAPRGDNAKVEQKVWDVLSSQSLLSNLSLESNIDAGMKAWEMSFAGRRNVPTNAGQSNSRVQLARATLKAWLARNLLEEPLTILVEIIDAS